VTLSDSATLTATANVVNPKTLPLLDNI
jgi:hypothetical protein